MPQSWNGNLARLCRNPLIQNLLTSLPCSCELTDISSWKEHRSLGTGCENALRTHLDFPRGLHRYSSAMLCKGHKAPLLHMWILGSWQANCGIKVVSSERFLLSSYYLGQNWPVIVYFVLWVTRGLFCSFLLNAVLIHVELEVYRVYESSQAAGQQPE